jgi:hypothetical protein
MIKSPSKARSDVPHHLRPREQVTVLLNADQQRFNHIGSGRISQDLVW